MKMYIAYLADTMYIILSDAKFTQISLLRADYIQINQNSKK
jgi:hypothetical protein